MPMVHGELKIDK